MRVGFMLVLGMVLNWVACAGAIAQGSTASLDVDVEATVRDDQRSLDFAITNKSSQPVQLRRRVIPWDCPASILVLVDDYRPAGILEPLEARVVNPASDCPNGARTLEPNDELRGSVDLDVYVAGLKEVLSRGGAVVYWYWRPDPMYGGDAMGYGGFEVIPGRGASPPGGNGGGVDLGAAPPIGVTALAVLDDYEPAIGFEVRNTGSENVSMYVDGTPWSHGAKTSVRAAVLSPSRALAPHVSHHSERGTRQPWITIPPRGFITGVIPMFKRVAHLGQERRSSDVIAFWFTELRSTTGVSLGRYGGFVVFPRLAGSQGADEAP